MMAALSFRARLAAACALVLCWSSTPAGAQTQAELFDDTTLHTVEIVIHSRDWSDLRENYRSNDFYPADVKHQDFYLKNPTHYRFYKSGCGREARLQQLWGKPGS